MAARACLALAIALLAASALPELAALALPVPPDLARAGRWCGLAAAAVALAGRIAEGRSTLRGAFPSAGFFVAGEGRGDAGRTIRCNR